MISGNNVEKISEYEQILKVCSSLSALNTEVKSWKISYSNKFIQIIRLKFAAESTFDYIQ